MTDATQQTAFRLPVTLIKRLDAHVQKLKKEQPGLDISRADVVRMLLTRQLDREEGRKGK